MNDPVRELLAANTKQYRHALGLSQMQLAEKLDMSTSLVASIETCTKFPSSETLNKLCKAFHVQVHQLFQPLDNKTDNTLRYYQEYSHLREQLQEDINQILNHRFEHFLTKEP